MNWQDYLALFIFAAAAGVVILRAYRVLFVEPQTGCGGGCGTCSWSRMKPPPRKALLAIEPERSSLGH